MTRDSAESGLPDPDALPRVFRAGNDAIRAAYQLGLEHGRREGYEEQARDHHQWLLNHDERLAEVASEARRFALLDAAEAWESETVDDLKDLAEKQYRGGGPPMPTIWLRLRAQTRDTAPGDLLPDPSMRCQIGEHSDCLFAQSGCPCACHRASVTSPAGGAS